MRPVGRSDRGREDVQIHPLGERDGDERRAEQFLAEVIDTRGRVRLGVFLVEDHLLFEGGTAPAVLGRPSDARPSGGGQMPIPGEPLFEELVLASGPALTSELGEFAGQVFFEPLADGGRKLCVLETLALIHVCTITYQAIAR